MDIKAYMNSDLKFIDGLVRELEENTTTWSTDKVLEKSGEMFDAFYRRFGLEDFLLKHVKPTAEMLPSLKKFLKVRNHFRETLENILMLHVDEPDFLTEIRHIHKSIVKHMIYLKTEFDPSFFDQLSSDQMAKLSADLEKKIMVLSFS